MVNAVTATSAGNTLTSMLSRSMTTDVSSTPRATRWSGTRFDALIGYRVEVLSELFAVDGRGGLEELGDGFRSHEAKPPKRGEFADGHAVACDNEGLALVEATHDLPAAVPELSLGHDLAHLNIVALCATPARKCSTRQRNAPTENRHFDRFWVAHHAGPSELNGRPHGAGPGHPGSCLTRH